MKRAFRVRAVAGECGESFCSFRLEAYFCSKSVFTSIVVLCTNGCIITIFFFFSRRSIMVMILMRKLAILSTFLLVIFFQTPADASLARIRKKPAPAPSEKTAKRTTHDHESTAPNSGNTGSTYLSAAQTCTVLNAVCQL